MTSTSTMDPTKKSLLDEEKDDENPVQSSSKASTSFRKMDKDLMDKDLMEMKKSGFKLALKTFDSDSDSDIDHEDFDVTDRKTRENLAQIKGEDFDDDNKSSITSINSDEKDENAIKTIEKLMISVTNEKNDLLDMKYQFNRILSLSKRKFVAQYLVERDILEKMLKAVHNKPDLVEIIFHTLTVICENDENMIFAIGKNSQFALSILNHLKCFHDSILLSLVKFLKIAVCSIQWNDESCWLGHLKTFEIFEHCITAMFQSNNEALIITAIDLLREIARTNLHGEPNLLKQLFKAHDLIPVLMKSDIQMIISKKDENSRIDSKFVDNWLSIMMLIRTDLFALFEETEEKQKYIFLKILFLMLHPYEEPDALFPKQEIDVIKQDIVVIYKCLSLLSYIRCQFYVPLIMDESLIKIILNLKRVLDIESEEKKSDSVKLLYKFSQWLNKVWLNLVQNSPSDSITKLMKPLDQKERNYFLQLDKDESHSYISKKRTIDDKLNKTEIVMLEFYSVLE